MKRALDVIASGVGLVLLSPLLFIIVIFIRADDGGPTLFRQVRVGRHNTRFEILKFRTMRVDRNGPSVTGLDDTRITPVGRHLRRHKLDELPQLINVLRGEMSLVGPRPEVPEFARYWTTEEAAAILGVRPGITDPASIRFRDESALIPEGVDTEQFYIENILPQKVGMYIEYTEQQTMLGDIRLIFLTLAGRSS